MILNLTERQALTVLTVLDQMCYEMAEDVSTYSWTPDNMQDMIDILGMMPKRILDKHQ